MIGTTSPPATRQQNIHRDAPSTARALVLEPRRAVLRALHTWAADQSIDSGDLAAFDRTLMALAAAEQGPNLDLVMRAARRRVISQARRRRRLLDAS